MEEKKMNIKKIKNISKIFNEIKKESIDNFIAAEILNELENLELKDDELEKVLKIGLDIYYNNDYATTAGIGVSLYNFLEENEKNIIDINYEEFQLYYYEIEWV